MTTPGRKAKPKARAATKRPTHTPPPAGATVRPPAPGPGRPRKPRAPRGEHQAALADAIENAEAARDSAAVEYSKALSVAAEIKLLHAELAVASSWSSYCRAAGIHSSALKYGEQVVKLAGRLVDLREIEAADRLDALVKRARSEDRLASGRAR